MTPTDTIDTSALATLAQERNVLLTTYRRDGTPVGTPVHIAGDGTVAYVRTFDPSGKLKRLRRNPAVEVAPCTIRGRVTGPAIRATARILDGDSADAAAAASALATKYPILQGWLIPRYHHLKGLVTTHIAVTEA